MKLKVFVCVSALAMLFCAGCGGTTTCAAAADKAATTAPAEEAQPEAAAPPKKELKKFQGSRMERADDDE